MDFKNLPPVKEQIMKCVRCGKCRSVCPVFAEIGNETAAPRGHVFMVQMLRDGIVEPAEEVNKRLTMCLLCENCSVNCPSGIDVHELNLAARSYIKQNNPTWGNELIFNTLWTRPSWLGSLTRVISGVQKAGLQQLARRMGLTKLLPGDLSEAEKILAAIPYRNARSLLKETNQAQGLKKYRIGYFLGCATNLLYPEIAVAAVEVLTQNGCEVIIPQQTKCCGLPQQANGRMDTARELAIHNIEVFKRRQVDYIITDCASCSSALSIKNMKFLLGETEHKDAAELFASRVMDLTKFLIDVLDIKLPVGDDNQARIVTYHDPCHLANAQGIKKQPRELLGRIPGVELVEMSDTNYCCGGSGTYGITHYQTSMKILEKKMTLIKQTGADLIATCCPSCTMQLNYGLKKFDLNCQVVHPVQLVNEVIKSRLYNSAS